KTRWCHGLCETEGTDSVIILDITESRGNSTDQVTVPSELPIRGDLNQVELTIQSATRDYFTLEGKKLRLKRPLDRDSDEITQIRLNIICRELSTSNQRNIPVLIRVTDINDNAPIFKENSYSCSVSELAPVGTTIFRDLSAIDKDANNNGLVEYYTVKGDGTHHDGYRSFAINLPYQGLVTVNKSLDYESTQKYYLTIQAVDRADRPEDRLTATTTLTIFVEDGDDQDPAFLHSGCTFVNNACVNVEYTAEVTSGALAGILKIRPDNIKAKDRDSLNSPIKYSFVNGTPLFYSEYFQIDPKRGNIRQIKAVDRSVSKIFSIIIKAEEETEGKRFTTAKLTVDVLPVDNNPPIITPTALIGYVDENSPVGTTVVTARDGKEPLKLVVTDADIAPDDPPVEYIFELTTNSFRVNADGYLVVNEAELDRDPPNPSKYTFQVIARQVNSTNGRGASAPITLNVHLNDVNDNSPRLPSLSPVRIQAGEGVRPVTQVQARDNDVGEFAKVTYSIYHVSNNGMSKFRVDPDSGHIQVVDKVVAGEQYSITIQATDTGGRFMQSIVDVIVVPGPNTGGPVFSKDKYEIQVSEGASLNSAVITVIAEDPERDKVKYSIIEGNINKDFDIGPNSGVIFVAKKLDREEVSTYNLLVKAEDPSGLFNTATVSITVTDINDQNPIFLQDNYTFVVDEGLVRAPIGVVQARDDDIGTNGEVLYSVSGNNDFSINPQNGEIHVKKMLDYEKQKKHLLVVTARDKAPDARLATASVTVLVNDVQDEKPIFTTPVYEAIVPENLPHQEIVQVQATDPDSVSSITYILKDAEPGLFAVDPVTGVVRTLRGLDFEYKNTYRLTVGTLENDSNDPRATCTVLVTVQDRNDVPPTFTSVPLPIRLQDTVPLGTVVTTVVATDADGTPPGNQVRYELSGRDKAPYYFLIDGNSGVVSVKDDLRKEPDSEYRIEVRARDLGEPSLSATATITVYVEHIVTIPPNSGLGFADSHYTDRNDVPPTFTSVPLPIRLQDTVPLGTVVTTVVATDADGTPPGNQVRYELSGRDKAPYYFLIDGNSGVVSVKDDLRKEPDSEYRIEVRARDLGEPSLSATATITVYVEHIVTIPPNSGLGFADSHYTYRFMQSIVDVIVVPGPNTGGPVFSKDKYEIQVSEGASLNSAVITVIAEDPERDKVKYSIIEGNINKDFDIGPNSGVIFVAKKLDREEVSTYNLLVKAEDPSGLFNTATVSITVTDINDQNPIFLQDNYTFVVDEGLVRAPIGVVQARDDDIGTNGEVLYSVSGNNDFSINPQNGEIHVKKMLDYEKQKKHLLVVTARDKAPDARLATASVTVLVNDVQDEKPIFTTPVYEAIVPENLPHQEIVQVQATDPDSVSSITYILKDAEPGLFAVDPVTGVVRTLRGLDFEYKNTYRLTVGTLENDSNDPRATCTVLVTVQDRNDVPPTFTSVPLPIRLQDTVPLGTVVTTVVATDADGTPPGNQVRYELSGRDKAPYYFLIDGNSGVVSVKDDLRKEPDSEYRIEVRARDLGEPSLSATATITVYVEHIVTIPPNSGLGFADSHYTVEVEENSLANTLIKVLPVINKPRGNFPIGCEIVSGNEQGHFYVSENEARDCEIRTRDQGLDYEKTSRYTLIINLNTVEGFFGSSRLTTQVIINIIDINDNRPQFVIPPRYSQLTSNRYLAALSSDAPVGTKFFQVISKDSDSGSNSRLSYEINRESDPENRFKIDSTSGFISNNKPVEDIVAEDLPLQLQLVVRDNPDLLSSSLLQTVEILINVINDDNRMVLVVKDALPNQMLDMKENILSVIQERTGIIPDFEKVSILKLLKNNSIETDSTGSDFWFYMVDPVTFRILDRNDPRIQSTVLEDDSQLGLVAEVSSVLGIKAKYIRLPFVLTNPDNSGGNTKHGVKPVKAEVGVSDLGAALIALACIIVLLGVVGIIYHCFMWSRYVAYRERMKRLCVAPRYEPVFVEPSLKEYETQVLQMSVPLDEEGSIPDPNLPINLKGLDAVSYITRDRGDGSASAFGGRTLSTFRGDSISQVDKMKIENNSMNTHPKLEDDMMIPVKNPLYDGYLDDIDDEPSLDRDDLDLKETQQKSSKPLHKIPHVETTTEL
ncbi:cadherin-99C-like, partial [Centruroides sculpturatus]|uniref:cadherin-99C-like n=1 Tax=Centruroides sculpturatus TaxID=218467 RepID=UPI000C6CE5DC